MGLRPDIDKTADLRDRQIARMLALGKSVRETSEALGLSVSSIRGRMAQPGFMDLVQATGAKLDEKLEDRVVEELLAAELEAVEAIRSLLKSKDDKVKLQAAQDLLNRAGKRGMPVQKQESKVASLDLNKPIHERLVAALADPKVQDYLEARPELREKLLIVGRVDNGSNDVFNSDEPVGTVPGPAVEPME